MYLLSGIARKVAKMILKHIQEDSELVQMAYDNAK